MSLRSIYLEKYGSATEKPADDPKAKEQKLAAAQGGKLASDAFWEELGILVKRDEGAAKK